VSPVAVQYGQEARMHEFFLLGAALSTWTLARALTRPGQWRWWLGYMLVTALNMYTVYLAFVVLAAQGCWVMATRWQVTHRRVTSLRLLPLTINSRLWRWLVSATLAFALYLPWWPTLLAIVTRRLAISDVESGVGPPLDFLIKGIYSLGPGPRWPAWLFLGLWALGVISLVAQRKSALALFGGLWLAFPLALPFVFRDPRAVHLRYVFLLPVYLLFVARGAMALLVEGWNLIAGGWPDSEKHRTRESGNREVGMQADSSTDLPNLRFIGAVALLSLVLISVLYLPGYYRRTKPDWRGAGAYLESRTIPGDVIVTGPLFDVGRYLDYYYDGPAELMPPAFLVANLSDRVASMRVSGGRVWAVTRFRPMPIAAVRNIQFPGLTVSEPVVAVYEPDPLRDAMIDLMHQAVAAAPSWADEMSAEGVLDPDPRTARAAAYLFLGDVYREAERLPGALAAYQAMVADYPASAGGYVILAETYEAAGQPEAAIEAYQRAVALNPVWQGVLAEEAAELADLGHWSDALAAYRAAVK
jgi:hypothetical protein